MTAASDARTIPIPVSGPDRSDGGARPGVGVAVALLCLAAVLAITVVAVVLAVRRARTGSLVGAGAAAGLAGFAVMSIADHPANAHRVAIAFWAVLAILATEVRPEAGQPVTAARSRSGSR